MIHTCVSNRSAISVQVWFTVDCQSLSQPFILLKIFTHSSRKLDCRTTNVSAFACIQQWKSWGRMAGPSCGWNSISLPETPIIHLVNTTPLVNGPELIQQLALCNLHAHSPEEPRGKLTPQTSRAARGRRSTNGPRRCSCPDKGPSLRKKTSNNALYSHWSRSQSLPLWISPFNINLSVTEQLYK